jgi:cyanophycin synthetase
VLADGCAVLNAEDDLVADFAELCDGEVIFFALDPANPVLAAHLAAGKRGVTVVDHRIVLRAGASETRICRLVDAPYIGKAKKPAHVANVLAGVAAGWGLGLDHDVLVTGVKTFGLELPDQVTVLSRGATKPLTAKQPAAAR